MVRPSLLRTLVWSGAGSLGNQTMQRYKGLYPIRRKPKPRNNKSAAQLVIQSAIGNAPAAWSALTDQQRGAWERLAQRSNPTNNLGQQIAVSGWSMYCSSAVRAAQQGQPAPPSPSGRSHKPPHPLSWGVGAVDFETLAVVATWHTPPPPVGSGDMCIIEVCQHQPPSRFAYHGPWQSVAVVDTTLVDGLTITVAGDPSYLPMLGEWQLARITRFFVAGQSSKAMRSDIFWGASPPPSPTFAYNPWIITCATSSVQLNPDNSWSVYTATVVGPEIPGVTIMFDPSTWMLVCDVEGVAVGTYSTTVSFDTGTGPQTMPVTITVDASIPVDPYGYGAWPLSGTLVFPGTLDWLPSSGDFNAVPWQWWDTLAVAAQWLGGTSGLDIYQWHDGAGLHKGYVQVMGPTSVWVAPCEITTTI